MPIQVKNAVAAIQEAQAFDELQMFFTVHDLSSSITEHADNLNTAIHTLGN